MAAHHIGARVTFGRKLRAWAEAKPEGAIVGQSGTPYHCPLANYLKAQGWDCVTVGRYWIEYHRANNTIWGQRPVQGKVARIRKLVDNTCWRTVEGRIDHSVSREQFLSILDQVGIPSIGT